MLTPQDIQDLQVHYEKVAEALLELIRCNGYKALTDDLETEMISRQYSRMRDKSDILKSVLQIRVPIKK